VDLPTNEIQGFNSWVAGAWRLKNQQKNTLKTSRKIKVNPLQPA
jgi:hypothetical protein